MTEPHYMIVDEHDRPWKIGVIWTFAKTCDRLARAHRYQPGPAWRIVPADADEPRRQLGLPVCAMSDGSAQTLAIVACFGRRCPRC